MSLRMDYVDVLIEGNWGLVFEGLYEVILRLERVEGGSKLEGMRCMLGTCVRGNDFCIPLMKTLLILEVFLVRIHCMKTWRFSCVCRCRVCCVGEGVHVFKYPMIARVFVSKNRKMAGSGDV